MTPSHSEEAAQVLLEVIKHLPFPPGVTVNLDESAMAPIAQSLKQARQEQKEKDARVAESLDAKDKANAWRMTEQVGNKITTLKCSYAEFEERWNKRPRQAPRCAQAIREGELCPVR